VKVPIEKIFKDVTNLKVVFDRAEHIHADKQHIVTKQGQTIQYDKLLLGLGNVTAYFGIKGLDEFSYSIKTVDEALHLRSHLHAEMTGDEKADLNYVIVGAGPTGVELAAEMVSYLNRLKKRYFVENKQFHINLVEAAPRILPSLSEEVSRKIEKRLKKLGVKVYTSTAVKAETADTIVLPEGNIDTHTVVWTAGVTNNPLFSDHKDIFKLGKGGRVLVGPDLSAAENIYVLGDSALTTHSGWAQTAIYDANFVTKNLKRQLRGDEPKGYTPPKPIAAIPVGPSWCAVQTEKYQTYGYTGWLVRRYMDLKLYAGLLPLGLALSTWLVGSRVEE
jgi:NADH dehydrogenase